MKNSIKKEIIECVGKILNDFVEIRSLYDNNIFEKDIGLNTINTDNIFTRVMDILDDPDKNSSEINQLDVLFKHLNKDTYELPNYNCQNYLFSKSIAFELFIIISFLNFIKINNNSC